MDERDPEEQSQQEIREDAAATPDDPHTRREALENELMDEGRSEEGEEIGQPID